MQGTRLKTIYSEFPAILKLNENAAILVNYKKVGFVYGDLFLDAEYGNISPNTAKLDEHLTLRDMNISVVVSV